MSRTVSLVQRVEIASPCPVSWDSMTGNDQVRFCGQCQLNVFNLSEMTAEEGERLIIEKEGKLCARIYRRRDGTILTRDCPVGLAAVRRRLVGFGVAVAASVMFALGALATCIFGKRFEGTYRISTYHQAKSKLEQWMGISPPQFSAGGIAMGSIMELPSNSDATPSPQPPPNWSSGFAFPLSNPSSADSAQERTR